MAKLSLPGSNLWNATTPWIDLFRWLGQDAEFPPPKAADTTVHSFVEKAASVPAVVALVGLVISVILLFRLCCCCRQPRRTQKPSSKPLLFMALLTAAVIVIGSFGCWVTGGRSFNTAENQLDHAVKDLDSAQSKGIMLNSTGTHMIQHLDLLYKQCPPPIVAAINGQLSGTVSDLNQFLKDISAYTTSVGPMAKRADDVKKYTGDSGVFIALFLALPMVLVTACCLIILLAVCATRGCGGSKMARCNDCCLIRFGSIFITLSVFVAAVVAASECMIGVVTGSFCHNVDANVLAYAQDAFGSNSTEYLSTFYYVTGLGKNPLNQSLVQGKTEVAKANATFTQMDQQYGETLSKQCQQWTAAPILEDIKQINAGIAGGLELVSRANVYDYYETMVHDDVCTTVIAGLGWLVVFQLVVGLCCLPAMALMSASFFTRWAAWKESQRGFLANPGPEVYMISPHPV